ncbi:MAG: VOC family protein [Nitrospira sp.]|jgi:catechol 2,3-dioxygenase-like lactoylglutathione lyase family enzyme|nr:VOC family protein [Nitrospira sp.]
METHYLGHVVFCVTDLQRALGFYRRFIGLQEVGRIFNRAAYDPGGQSDGGGRSCRFVQSQLEWITRSETCVPSPSDASPLRRV